MSIGIRKGIQGSVPTTTHQWLRPLYLYLQGTIGAFQPTGATGMNGFALQLGNAVPQTDIGNPTGILGFYGATGIQQPTGTGSFAGTTAASGYDVRSNGGSGTNVYSFGDVVAALKGQGLLAR